MTNLTGDRVSCSALFRKSGPQRLEAGKELTRSVWAMQASPREMLPATFGETLKSELAAIDTRREPPSFNRSGADDAAPPRLKFNIFLSGGFFVLPVQPGALQSTQWLPASFFAPPFRQFIYPGNSTDERLKIFNSYIVGVEIFFNQ